MKKKLLVLVLMFMFALVFTPGTFAGDDLELNMENFWGPIPPGQTYQDMTPEQIMMANQNMNDAVDPVLDMFGFLAGGGLYNSGDVHGIAGFDVGVKLTAMQVADDQLPFLPDLSSNYQYGPLQGQSVIPLPMLHAGVGLFGNFEVLGRFFSYPMGDEGNLTLIGIGAKYGLLQNFALPKVAVVAAYHYLTLPDEYDFASVNSMSAAVVVSKGFPIISVYGGLGLDHVNLEIDLDPIPYKEKFNKTNFRGNVGLKLTPFPFLFINLDYNFGAVEGLSMGAGLSIR